jgi:hypothetical protein
MIIKAQGFSGAHLTLMSLLHALAEREREHFRSGGFGLCTSMAMADTQHSSTQQCSVLCWLCWLLCADS